MASKRVFSEQEAAEIMQRAVRLQESSSTGDYTPGVTEDELKRIALEAGIDVAYLEKAIARLGEGEESKTGVFNLSEEFSRVVEGEIDPKNYDRIMLLVTSSSRNGLKQVGRTLSGPTMVGPHMVNLTVESRKGRTKINVKYMPFMAYMVGMHAPLIAALVTFAGLAGSGNVMLGAGIAAGLLAIGGFAFRALVRAGRNAARKLTGQVVEVVEEEADALRQNLSHSSSGVEEEREKQPEKA